MSELISFIYQKFFQINKRSEHFKRKEAKDMKRQFTKKLNDIYLHVHIRVVNILRKMDYVNEIIIGFYKKKHLGVKDVLIEIKNMRAKI